MPTVLRLAANRVVIFPDDHAPAHVHVFQGGRTAVFILDRESGSVSLRETEGFSLAETRRLSTALRPHVNMLCQHWDTIHGHR